MTLNQNHLSVVQEIVDRANPLSEYSDRKNQLLMDIQDQQLIKKLIEIKNEDYIEIPYKLRFALCFVSIMEFAKADGQKFKVCRDMTGSYIVKAYCQHKGFTVHYETEIVHSHLDVEVLIKYMNKPHYKKLDLIVANLADSQD